MSWVLVVTTALWVLALTTSPYTTPLNAPPTKPQPQGGFPGRRVFPRFDLVPVTDHGFFWISLDVRDGGCDARQPQRRHRSRVTSESGDAAEQSREGQVVDRDSSASAPRCRACCGRRCGSNALVSPSETAVWPLRQPGTGSASDAGRWQRCQCCSN